MWFLGICIGLLILVCGAVLFYCDDRCVQDEIDMLEKEIAELRKEQERLRQ